ncbi:hypothetical protein [Streptomyces sp. NPDC087294]|uniref:hypothetical protein n=1 Tax=Streptomyces sp. NPDC087294 TaxID=3365777 RepID=UPI00381A893E
MHIMRPEVIRIFRTFELDGKVTFHQLDENTWVLLPVESGSALIVQDLGGSLRLRTGHEVVIDVDYEEESSREALPEIITALQSGNAVEHFSMGPGRKLRSCGYRVDYPSGTDSSINGRAKSVSARLPRWNAR